MKDLNDILLNEGVSGIHKHYNEQYKTSLIWVFLIGLVIGSIGAII
ncbi:MAG: hypothetical protein V4721_10465 [Bacteroidota bacterium]